MIFVRRRCKARCNSYVPEPLDLLKFFSLSFRAVIEARLTDEATAVFFVNGFPVICVFIPCLDVVDLFVESRLSSHSIIPLYHVLDQG